MENIIQWQRADNIKNDKASGIYIKKGERYQYLIHKSFLGGLNINQATLALAQKDNKGNIISYNLEEENNNIIREVESDKYYPFDIIVGSTPNGTYKQFALTRPNGSEFLGTFKSQEQNLEKYINELIEFYESYPYTRVDVIRRGNVLRLHVYKNTAVKNNSEKLSVGIGEVTDQNINTPSLTASLFNASYSVPQEVKYSLSVQPNINEGNIFRVGSKTVVASSKDTPSSIIQKLGVDEVIVRSPASLDVEALNGSFIQANTNTPQVSFDFVNTHSGQDRYTISISNAQNGNEINIYWQTGSTGWRVITGLSSTYTINDWIEDTFYNPSLSPPRFEVPSGSILTSSFRRGTQSIPNTNNPSFAIDIVEVKPTRTVKAFQLNIGGTVVRGNEYIIRELNSSGSIISEFKYVAVSGDTLDSVYSKLPIEVDGYIYSSTTGSILAFALKGNPYDETNIADVQILSQPRQYLSNHVVANFKAPLSLKDGVYNLVIQNKSGDVDIKAVSAKVTVVSSGFDSSVITFGDNKEAFGVPYYEEGLTQTMRLPLFFKNKKPIITEEETTNINRKVVNSLVGIQYSKAFSSRAMPSEFANGLIPLMKHKNTFIGAEKVKFNEIEVGDEVGIGMSVVSGTVIYQDEEFSNYSNLMYDDMAYIEKANFKWRTDGCINHIVLRNADVYSRNLSILDNDVYVPLAAYSIRFWVNEKCKVELYKNGVLIKEYEALEVNRYHRIEDFTRFEQDDEITFKSTRI